MSTKTKRPQILEHMSARIKPQTKKRLKDYLEKTGLKQEREIDNAINFYLDSK